MLGQVDIGTLAQRRTNGWQMVGPTLAHRRPNIGMFMGLLGMSYSLDVIRDKVSHPQVDLISHPQDDLLLRLSYNFDQKSFEVPTMWSRAHKRKYYISTSAHPVTQAQVSEV